LKVLAAKLQKLERAVDGADADPSPDTRTAYASLSKMLAGTLAAWSQLKQTELKALDDGLNPTDRKQLGR
jgi:hypothetical protein